MGVRKLGNPKVSLKLRRDEKKKEKIKQLNVNNENIIKIDKQQKDSQPLQQNQSSVLQELKDNNINEQTFKIANFFRKIRNSCR
jgi:hypothetical protein